MNTKKHEVTAEEEYKKYPLFESCIYRFELDGTVPNHVEHALCRFLFVSYSLMARLVSLRD